MSAPTALWASVDPAVIDTVDRVIERTIAPQSAIVDGAAEFPSAGQRNIRRGA